MKELMFVVIISYFFGVIQAPPVPNTVSDVGGFWLARLLMNLLGYGTVIIPAHFVIKYLKSIKYNETGANTCIFPIIKACVFGENVIDRSTQENARTMTSLKSRGCVLVLCAAGLQGSYLTWGVIQERIMTKEYGATSETLGEKFTNSQFLVFVNRLLAFAVSGIYIAVSRQPRHGCPLYKFSFSSFSNVMSSWFQYEALKFVSFPTQVLGKACKVIPVMLMGKVVSGNVYEVYEWVTAGMLSVGISFFLLSQGTHDDSSVASTSEVESYVGTGTIISGVLLMLGYMAFDSFTSNWQGELFKKHKMSSFQMMFGVNMFSCILTACSLLEQGGFLESFGFVLRHLEFGAHAVILSICSAVGQLFIFYTISEFGAVVFTIIMTLRQAFAILLSCLIYGHPVSLLGFFGIVVVFIALFLRIYARARKSRIATKKPQTDSVAVPLLEKK